MTVEKIERDLRNQIEYAHRIARLVDDILDVSRMSEGKLTFHAERFDLCELVQEAVGRFKVTAEKSGVEVRVDASEPIQGMWDRFRLEQVCINLLTNALKYGKNKPIHVRVFSEKGLAQFSVRDEGIGVKKEDQERIFGRFERAISENEVSGMGLGLYISRQIVLAHRGSIGLKSEVDKGSEFIVMLPVASD
jgi:two-component system OmpR family sensor kinase